MGIKAFSKVAEQHMAGEGISIIIGELSFITILIPYQLCVEHREAFPLYFFILNFMKYIYKTNNSINSNLI